jgi:hypothetical protein
MGIYAKHVGQLPDTLVGLVAEDTEYRVLGEPEEGIFVMQTPDFLLIDSWGEDDLGWTRVEKEDN